MPDNEKTPTPGPAEAAQAPLIPTPVAEWKRKARALWRLRLPSGNVIEARRVDLTRLLSDGILTAEDWAPMNDMESTEPVVKRVFPVARKAVPYIAVSPAIGASDNGIPLADDALDVDVDLSRWDVVQLFLWSGGWAQLEGEEVTVN